MCDQPSKFDSLQQEFMDKYNVLEDGHAVSRRSDFIIYSVEAANISQVVKLYGPCILLLY